MEDQNFYVEVHMLEKNEITKKKKKKKKKKKRKDER